MMRTLKRSLTDTMLSKKNRVSRKEFPSPLGRGGGGFRVFSPLFSAVVYPKEKQVSISVVVSKKTATRAVVRNTIRRRVYAAVEPHLKSFLRGATIVFYPKAEAYNTPFALLQEEVEQVLTKAKLIKRPLL